jgi:hypothetical protein
VSPRSPSYCHIPFHINARTSVVSVAIRLLDYDQRTSLISLMGMESVALPLEYLLSGSNFDLTCCGLFEVGIWSEKPFLSCSHTNTNCQTDYYDSQLQNAQLFLNADFLALFHVLLAGRLAIFRFLTNLVKLTKVNCLRFWCSSFSTCLPASLLRNFRLPSRPLVYRESTAQTSRIEINLPF